jgi:hypothetical protein
LFDRAALGADHHSEKPINREKLELEVTEGNLLLCTTPSPICHFFINPQGQEQVQDAYAEGRKTLLHVPSGRLTTAALERAGVPGSMKIVPDSESETTVILTPGWYQLLVEEIGRKDVSSTNTVLKAKLSAREIITLRVTEWAFFLGGLVVISAIMFTAAAAIARAWTGCKISLICLIAGLLLMAALSILPPLKRIRQHRDEALKEWERRDTQLRIHMFRRDQRPWMYGLEVSAGWITEETVTCVITSEQAEATTPVPSKHQ